MKIRMVITIGALLFLVFSNNIGAPQAGGPATEKNSEMYSLLLDKIISNCDFRSSLIHSRSEGLRENAYRAQQVANYIRANKQQLIQQMITYDLKAKQYRVERFVSKSYGQYQASN